MAQPRISRRSFLVGTAAAGATAIIGCEKEESKKGLEPEPKEIRGKTPAELIDEARRHLHEANTMARRYYVDDVLTDGKGDDKILGGALAEYKTARKCITKANQNMLQEQALAECIFLMEYGRKTGSGYANAIEHFDEMLAQSNRVLKNKPGMRDGAATDILSWESLAMYGGGQKDRAVDLAEAALSYEEKSGKRRPNCMAARFVLANQGDEESTTILARYLNVVMAGIGEGMRQKPDAGKRITLEDVEGRLILPVRDERDMESFSEGTYMLLRIITGLRQLTPEARKKLEDVVNSEENKFKPPKRPEKTSSETVV